MGELHLEIIVDRMQREFSVGANVGKPQVAYRETIRQIAEYDYTHKKQTGGSGQYARVKLPDLHWVIAGEGKLRESLIAEIQRLGLGDRVHLIGQVDRVDALIAAADVFVLSSKSEGLGSVVLHALALGRPVVATAAGGIPEILPPDALVAVEAAEALAQKVVDVLDHPTPVPFPPGLSAGPMAQGVLDVYRALL